MSLATGSYTGNGLDNRAITGVGFRADFVVIKVRDFGQRSISKTSTMANDVAKPLAGTSAPIDYIRTIDADGFTIRTDTTVNLSGRVYDWMAFKAAAGQMAVGSYTGDDVVGRAIAVGFQPTIVFLLPQASARQSLQKTATMAANHRARIRRHGRDGRDHGPDRDRLHGEQQQPVERNWHALSLGRLEGRVGPDCAGFLFG